MTIKRKYSKVRRGVVYSILCNITGEIYIGSTANFSRRKCNHKDDLLIRKKNPCVSLSIIKRGDYTFNIIEIVNVRYELSLLLKEQWYLERIPNINTRRALSITRSINRKVENKWYEKNKEKRKKYHKEWYDKNRNKEKEKKSKRYTCECGRQVRCDSKWRHEKTNIHKKIMLDRNIECTTQI